MNYCTYNTPLVFNNKVDEQEIIDLLKTQQFVFNECSKIQFNIKTNSISILHKNFYKNFRAIYPNVPSQVIIKSQQEVLACYRSIKSNKHKISKPAEKHNLSMRMDRNCFSYKNEIASIISLNKRIKCKLYKYEKLDNLLKKYKFQDPLIFIKNNKIFISLSFNILTELPSATLALGVDLGVRNFAATSEGNIYKDSVFLGKKRRLRYLKDLLKSKQKNSRSAKKKLKKLNRKERNINKNFNYHLVNRILNDSKADVFVLENLKSIKVKRNHFQNKNRISQISFYNLLFILSYKALLQKKQVITVCPSYTSQIDSRTNKRDGLRKGCRYYGKDGTVLHADINAACNIAIRSKHPVSQSIKPLTYGQVTINTPIVGSFVPANSRPRAVSC